MSIATLRDFGRTVRELFSKFADFLAKLSFWRFVGLCLLVLIAAGIAGDLLSGARHQSAHKKAIVVEQKAIDENVAAPEPVPDTDPSTDARPVSPPEPPKPSKPPRPPKLPKTANGSGDNLEIQIGSKGIIVREGNDPQSLDSRIEKKLDQLSEDDDESSSSSSLPFFLIVLMIIARFVASSKLKAEAQTVAARDVAERETLSRQLAEARLQAMQAQVEPHFLFNTLAAVEHLIETDPPRAARMQGNLIGYLRSVMPNFRKPDSTLGREVEICRHYLEILKVRMEDRLQVQIDVPADLSEASLPPLMLQSLVENAIRHGLEPKPEGGSLHIRAEAVDGHLAVTVIDTGVGFAPGAGKSGAVPNGAGGVGLSSLRERLSALFGTRGRLTISPNIPQGTQVRLEVPYPADTATHPGNRGAHQ